MKKLIARNKEGNTLSLVFREYREGDEDGIIACIRDEYEDTYFKQDFYNPAYIKKQAEKGLSHSSALLFILDNQRNQPLVGYIASAGCMILISNRMLGTIVFMKITMMMVGIRMI